ncbi:hypothetical protein MMC34_002620 [Xylographa carneopallida]|nr:hypothetical protein [Xylographa carneopallida]
MSTAVWPYLPPDELTKAEEVTLARELEWLLNSFQETLASLKSGLEECVALLAPKEPGSTLVLSSLRSECVKGFVTRVGTRIVKGDIHIRLPTLPPFRSASSYPLHLSSLPTAPSLVLTQLTSVCNLINQSLDVVDTSTWTGDAHDANFIAGQLRLLSDLIQEARQALKGGNEVVGKWWESSVDENIFEPPLPPTLSFHLSICEASLLLQLRTLQLTNPSTPTSFTSDALPGLSLRQRLGLAARLPEHDESGRAFTFRGQEARVREKVRVESQDPSLMAVMAKLSALEHAVGVARGSLAIVMGVEEEEEEDG